MTAPHNIACGLLLLLSGPGNAQWPCAMRAKYDAGRLFASGRYAGSVAAYARFEELQGHPSVYDLLGWARAHVHLRDSAACFLRTLQAVEYGAWYGHARSELDLSKIPDLKDMHWDGPGMEKLHAAHERYMSGLDGDLAGRIGEMYRTDQRTRSDRTAAGDSTAYRARVHEADSLHVIQLWAIIAHHDGFPSGKLIGPDAHFQLVGLFQHASRAFPAAFDSLSRVLLTAAQRGYLAPNEYAAMCDRHQYDIDKHSIYGEVPVRDGSGRLSVTNVLDPMHVDERRSAIGLPPLEEHAAERDALLPSGYRRGVPPCPK